MSDPIDVAEMREKFRALAWQYPHGDMHNMARNVLRILDAIKAMEKGTWSVCRHWNSKGEIDGWAVMEGHWVVSKHPTYLAALLAAAESEETNG